MSTEKRGRERLSIVRSWRSSAVCRRLEGLEALYVCWNDRVSRDLGALMKLLLEFAASGVTVQLVDDPVGPGVQK